MGCASSSEGSASGAPSNAATQNGRGSPPGPSARGATETLPEPWESTIKRGFGYAQATDEQTVRAAMRYSLDESERSRFAQAQAAEKDEHTRLRSYVDRAAAAAHAAAASGTASAPLRGSEGWGDSDASLDCRIAYGHVTAHAATVAGTRGGGARPNQDAFGLTGAVVTPHAPHPLLLASVFDGHGPQGHYISRHVRDRLPAWISSCARDDAAAEAAAASSSDLAPWVLRATSAYSLCAAGEQVPRLARLAGAAGPTTLPASLPAWARAVVRAFIELDADLCAGRSQLLSACRVTPQSSGCTAVCALLSPAEGLCLVAAAGDSAAFLAEEVGGDNDGRAPAPDDEGVEPQPAPPGRRPRYAARLLTGAHKPLGDEAQRVRLAGGRVSAHPGEAHIPRVWPREQDVKPNAPAFGLAVSRAFGDSDWKAAGVCAAPDVTLHALRPRDAFLLLCSDGVTDVISGAMAVAAAADALHAAAEEGVSEAEAAANAAVAVNAAAVEAWARRFPKHSRDDITTVVVALRPLTQLGGAEKGRE